MDVLHKYFSEFTNQQTKQFAALYELYKVWNEKINVISRKDMDNFYVHHVLHSLTIAAIFEFPANYKIMDLGTGGGFPGIPLAIFFPESQFLLVDSINKKLTVAKEIAHSIGLNNIETKHSRAEELPVKNFDVIVSRAVAPLKNLWKWSKPLLKNNKNKGMESPNGLICLKGGDLATEIQQSHCKPNAWEISKLFSEDYFKEKFLLYQPLG